MIIVIIRLNQSNLLEQFHCFLKDVIIKILADFKHRMKINILTIGLEFEFVDYDFVLTFKYAAFKESVSLAFKIDQSLLIT